MIYLEVKLADWCLLALPEENIEVYKCERSVIVCGIFSFVFFYMY